MCGRAQGQAARGPVFALLLARSNAVGGAPFDVAQGRNGRRKTLRSPYRKGNPLPHCKPPVNPHFAGERGVRYFLATTVHMR